MEKTEIVSLVQNIVRDAMAIREDSWVPPNDWIPGGYYEKSLTRACEEACEKHEFPDLFPVIHAAVYGGWNEMNSWVNL